MKSLSSSSSLILTTFKTDKKIICKIYKCINYCFQICLFFNKACFLIDVLEIILNIFLYNTRLGFEKFTTNLLLPILNKISRAKIPFDKNSKGFFSIQISRISYSLQYMTIFSQIQYNLFW